MGIVIKKIILDGELKKVWEFITKPENFSKYVYGYMSGKITSPNTTGIGASYEWHGRLGPFRLKSIEKIVGWQEQKHVAYAGKLLGVKFNSSMNIKEAKKDKTTLIVSVKYDVPFYLGGKLINLILVKWIIQGYIKKSLGRLNTIFAE